MYLKKTEYYLARKNLRTVYDQLDELDTLFKSSIGIDIDKQDKELIRNKLNIMRYLIAETKNQIKEEK